MRYIQQTKQATDSWDTTPKNYVVVLIHTGVISIYGILSTSEAGDTKRNHAKPVDSKIMDSKRPQRLSYLMYIYQIRQFD